MELSVIITTYNQPEWLRKVLIGFEHQKMDDFEVIVADDGSDEKTRMVIDSFRNKFKFPIKHVWHPDTGFNKCAILNKAIVESASNYLVFTDGDCIPEYHFMQVHADRRDEGHFLSGGYLKLPMAVSKAITEEDISSQRCFDAKWLHSVGLPSSFKNTKLTFKGGAAALMNVITPTGATWNGHNSSAWKKDILAVNGYDERMRYGALDREMGERMMNNGIKGIQIRYSAICIHLDHSRGYKNKTDLDNNAAIRNATKSEKKTWTDFGIKKPE